jgi:hypothetical protein
MNMRMILLGAALLLAQRLLAGEPDLRCEKNWGEMRWEGMTFHRYHLRAKDFPPDKTYKLIVENCDGVRTETFDYKVNKRGNLILVRPDEDYKDDIYLICSAKRGEKLTFWMQSNDDAHAVELVPFPLTMRSKKGAVLSLELQGEKGEQFLFMAHKMEPCEEVSLFLETKEGRVLVKNGETSEYGEMSALIDLPSDQSGGEAKAVLKRRKEEAALGFVWGPPALKIVGACCFEIK